MALIILRLIFIGMSMGLGVMLVGYRQLESDPTPIWFPGVVLASTIGLAMLIIAFDIYSKQKELTTISALYFGLLVGLLLAYIAGLALGPLFPEVERDPKLRRIVYSLLATFLCYICVSMLLQTKNDFRFIIPYVEFSKQVKGLKPLLLDTSVIIDGRIADVLETGVLDNLIVVPRFVIAELQTIADSSDRQRRIRGRRGLDVLNRLQNMPSVDVKIEDRELPEFENQPVDSKLVLLAKNLDGKIVTNDFNLNKVAQLHGVGVVNLNELANTLKPVYMAGESLQVQIIKPGEEAGQGVGYLDDGTMIVIEAGGNHIHETAEIAVTSVLQTNAGRMVFGRFEKTLDSPQQAEQ